MSPHRTLGISEEAAPDEVRMAFRHYARLHHPDAGGDPEQFQRGVEAYRSLRGRAMHAPVASQVCFHRKPRGLAVVRGWREARRRPRRVV